MIRKLQKMVKPWRVPLGLTILVYILFRVLFLVGYVPTASMEPTLPEGSFIIGSRVFQEPKVGEIIVFEKDGTLLVKRVAAGPGDTVDLSKLVYMAAVPIPIREETVITVPDGYYFVLGDNVQNSWDSRYWDYPYVEKKSIVAMVK